MLGGYTFTKSNHPGEDIRISVGGRRTDGGESIHC